MFLPLPMILPSVQDPGREARIEEAHRRLKSWGFELRPSKLDAQGTFLDPKSGFEGAWVLWKGAQDPDLKLCLKVPGPLDRTALFAKFTPEERKEYEPQYSRRPIQRLDASGRIEIEAGFTDRSPGHMRWEDAVMRARRLVEFCGTAIPMTPRERGFDFSQIDELPADFVLKSISMGDLVSIGSKYEWPGLTNMPVDKPLNDSPWFGGAPSLFMRFPSGPQWTIDLTRSRDGTLLGPSAREFKIQATLFVGDQDNRALVRAARALLPSWRITSDSLRRYDLVTAELRVDLTKGLTVERIGEGVLDRLEECAEAQARLAIKRK